MRPSTSGADGAAERPLPRTLNGRRVYTREDIATLRSLGRSTLERWYKERQDNRHPEPAGRLDRQLVWDAEAWDAWYDTRNDTTGLLTLAELAASAGISPATAALLWSQRDTNGHPTWAKTVDRTHYWNPDEWSSWYATHRQHTASQIDRSHDPDELVTLSGAARILGMTPSSITGYPERPPIGWPQPVRVEPLSNGTLRRWYTAGSIVKYADQRSGAGGRPKGGKAHYPDGTDPRIQTARQALHDAAQANPKPTKAAIARALAAQHGGAAGTWINILSEAARSRP